MTATTKKPSTAKKSTSVSVVSKAVVAAVTPASPPVAQTVQRDSSQSKINLQTSIVALVAGLNAEYQPDDVFQLTTGAMTCTEVVAELNGFVSAAQTTDADYNAWRNAVEAERATELQVRPLRANLKSILAGRYGKGGNKMAQFGFTPAKPVVKTSQSKTAAAVKAKATREARGTRGRQQKKTITGNVTGVIITPVTAGTVTPSPAASQPQAGSQGSIAGAPAIAGASVAPGVNAVNGAGAVNGASVASGSNGAVAVPSTAAPLGHS